MFNIYVREVLSRVMDASTDAASPLAEEGAVMDDISEEDVDPDDQYDDDDSFIDDSFTYPEDGVDYVPNENEDPEYDLGYFNSHICFCTHPSHGLRDTQDRLDGLLGLEEDDETAEDELTEDYGGNNSISIGDRTI